MVDILTNLAKAELERIEQLLSKTLCPDFKKRCIGFRCVAFDSDLSGTSFDDGGKPYHTEMYHCDKFNYPFGDGTKIYTKGLYDCFDIAKKVRELATDCGRK